MVNVYATCWQRQMLDVTTGQRTVCILCSAAAPQLPRLTHSHATPCQWHVAFVVLSSSSSGAPLSGGAKLLLQFSQLVWLHQLALRTVAVTSGAHRSGAPTASSAVSDAAHGGVWGLARVARLEQPNQPTQAYDGRLHPNQDCGGVVREVASMDLATEDELVIAGSSAHVARLRLCGAAGAASAASHRLVGGTYMITGGLGGLGVRTSEMLAEAGAAHLLLASRSGRMTRHLQVPSRLHRRPSVPVYAAACDSTEPIETAKIAMQGHPLTGYLHAAGILRDRLLGSITERSLRAVAAPKASAAWHTCSSISALVSLETAMLFSSVTAAFGNIGQASYAFANAFLDALALQKSASGCVLGSLQIPAVGGAGMGAASFDDAQLVELGAISLDVFAACMAFALEPTQVAAASTLAPLPDALVRVVVLTSALLSELRSNDVKATACLPCSALADTPLAHTLAPLTAPQQREIVENAVQRVVAELTGSSSEVGVETPLMQAGVDSLAATELVSRLRSLTGLALAPTLMFEQPSARAVAAHILGQLGLAAPSACTVTTRVVQGMNKGMPVAMVSCLGVWPGGCVSHMDRWQLQSSSADAMGSVPRMRWALDAVAIDTTMSEVQRRCIAHGGFAARVECFDHRSFGISQAEAHAMDPQQRLLLELGYSALHSSTERRSSLLESDNGIFLGIERPDWALVQPPTARSSVYAVTGDNISAAAGRLSYVLGVQGPCASVDTACASALSALHGGAHSARRGECGSALALAVSLKLSPHGTLGAALAGMLSIDGRCKTLDARANGYARSEGAGATVLRSDSTAENTSMLLGSLVRQDGRSASLTAPNGSAQRKLMLATLQFAALSASEVCCLEMHGTGTALGDPTEAGSLAAVHMSAHGARPMSIGAAKASVGHAEAASGQIGLLKVLDQPQRAMTVPNSQLRVLSELVLSRIGVVAAEVMIPTQIASGVRFEQGDGLSSFGYSGTIAHVLLSAAEANGRTGQPLRSSTFAFRRSTFSLAVAYHPFVQKTMLGSHSHFSYSSTTNRTLLSLVSDHIVQERVVFPGAAHIELARAASAAVCLSQKSSAGLMNVFFLKPLLLDCTSSQLICNVSASGFEICSQNEPSGNLNAVLHCNGSYGTSSVGNPIDHVTLHGNVAKRAMDISKFYDTFYSVGLQYGPAYRTLKSLWGVEGSTAAARLRARGVNQGTLVHPADLDDAFCVSALTSRARSETRLPFAVDMALLQGIHSVAWVVSMTPCPHPHACLSEFNCYMWPSCFTGCQK